MVSVIDPTKPAAGAASTADVRNNFAAAKSEIEALQTGKQAASARLAALAAILLAADKLLYAIGSDSFATADLTAFARTLLASPNAAAARTVLGAAAPAATLSGYGITDAYTKAQTDAAISAGATSALALFVGSAPAALDTWAELVAAIQADQSGLGALTTAVAGKASMTDVDAAIAAAVLAGSASIGAGDSSLRVTDTGAGVIVGRIDGVDVMKIGTPASVQPTKNAAGADTPQPNVLTVYASKSHLRLHGVHGDDNAVNPGQGGNVQLYGGHSTVGSNKDAGSVNLIGGKADGTGTGGVAGVRGGDSTGAAGGMAYLEGGQGATTGGGVHVKGGPGAVGGAAQLIGGDPGNGPGGDVLIATPDSIGTNQPGADVTISVGHGTGAARHGRLVVIVPGDVTYTVGGTFRLNGSRVATVADIPDAYTAAQVDAKIAAAVASFAAAAGQIVPFAGSTLPPNSLWCDGAYYEPSQYPLLYAAIGFAYGQSGTKFRVPNLGGRFPMGADATHPRGSVGGSAETQALHLPVGASLAGGSGVLSPGQTGYLTGLRAYDEASFTDWQTEGPYTTTAPAAGAQASLPVVGADGAPTTGTSGNIPPYQAVNWIINIGVTAG